MQYWTLELTMKFVPIFKKGDPMMYVIIVALHM